MRKKFKVVISIVSLIAFSFGFIYVFFPSILPNSIAERPRVYGYVDVNIEQGQQEEFRNFIKDFSENNGFLVKDNSESSTNLARNNLHKHDSRKSTLTVVNMSVFDGFYAVLSVGGGHVENKPHRILILGEKGWNAVMPEIELKLEKNWPGRISIGLSENYVAQPN